MGANSQSTSSMIRRFCQDWLLFAPMAILVAIVVSWLVGGDIVSRQVQSGALITYGLSFFLAFFEDLPVSEWEANGRGWGFLSTVVGLLYWVVIGLGLIGITIVFTFSAIDFSATPVLSLFMTAFGWTVVGVGFLVGIGALATRIRERSQ